MSIAIRHLDLSRADPELAAAGATGAVFTVFWWGDLPLGARLTHPEELPLGPGQIHALTVEFLTEQLLARDPQLGAPLLATHEGVPKPNVTYARAAGAEVLREQIHALADASTSAADDISVVICTRDRGALLNDCLTSLLAQRSPPGEIIVVDNSASGSARALCEPFAPIVYVHEPRPGLSIARNTGIRAAKGDKIAFTDDDVAVHPGWLAEMARAFAESGAEAVTGLVLPTSLDSAAQCCFQFEMGGFGSRFGPLLFDAHFFAETRPHGAQVWKIGAGANMAFRRAAFERAGLFDERLGAGASGCSEDSEFWYRLLALGGNCWYEPRMVVFHTHRPQWLELQRQMRAYMRGHVAALIVQADTFNDRGNWNRIALQLPRYFLRTLASSIVHGRRGRAAILAQEVMGWMAGLQYLARPGWRRIRVERLPP